MRGIAEGFVIFMIAFSSSMIGYAYGEDEGANKACASMGLERANDKCMKVTREPV